MTDLRKLAKGQECMLRLPGVCNHNPETTVLAHIRHQWRSKGSKPSDICGVWACSACHDEIDSRTKFMDYHEAYLYKQLYILDALCRQLHWYVKNDILKW